MFILRDGCERYMEFQSRITVAICITIRVRISSKKRTMPGTDIYFILSIKRVLDRLGWGAPFIILKSLSCTVYQSLFEINVIVTGRVDFQVSSLKTLTLLITFEQWVLKLWYSTWVFLVIRPFRGYHYFLPCDLDLRVWPNFWKL